MQITGADRYQPEKLSQLEKHVDEQVSTNTYNLEANLALLRLYQFQPSSVKTSVLVKVLLKAIMRLPSSDFKICIHLIPEKLQEDETLHKVVQLANFLETTKFQDFWTTAASCSSILNSVPGFYEAVRAFVLHVVTITFAKVPKKILGEYLKLEGAALDKLIAEKRASSGWSVMQSQGGDVIVLPKNDHNALVVKRAQELIKFEQVAPLIKTLTVGF